MRLIFMTILGLTSACATTLPKRCETQACEHAKCGQLAVVIAARMAPDGARRAMLLGQLTPLATEIEQFLHERSILCEEALARESGEESTPAPAEPLRRLKRIERE